MKALLFFANDFNLNCAQVLGLAVDAQQTHSCNERKRTPNTDSLDESQ